MKTNLKIWAAIFAIVAAGILITQFTRGYVSRQTAQYASDLSGTSLAGAPASGVPAADSGEGEAATEILAEEEAVPLGDTSSTGSEMEAGEGKMAVSADAGGEESAAGGEAESALADEAAPAAALAETMPRSRSLPDTAEASEAGAASETGTALETGPLAGTAEITADIAAVPENESVSADGMPVPLEETAAPSEEAAAAVPRLAAAAAETKDYHEQLSDIRERLPQVEAQIERLRSSDTDNNMYNVKSLAQSEQKIWERELDAVYDLLMEALPENEAEELKKDQQSWLAEATKGARADSSKNGGGSMESVEYAAAMAEAARERVYALLDAYE